jgi:ketosteroid isomerase-like protein
LVESVASAPHELPTMPSPATLEAFIARVVSGAHAEAIEEFYTPDSTMQENQSPPRVGRDTNVANERRVLSRTRVVHTTCVRPVLVDGDHVVIRWIFRFDRLDGTVVEMEELAWQRLEGERIAEETFFYDPAQLVPKPPQA